MKVGNKLTCGPLAVRSILVAIALLTPRVNATVRVVQFGGSFGLSYSPSSFSATVGDTIRWQGIFSTHPLSSTTIPVGASSWQNGTGTVFDYVVKVAGTYNYQCDVHGPSMSGSFTVSLTGVADGRDGQQISSFRLEQNYPNPFNPTTVVRGQWSVASDVKLVVYNLLGQEVAIMAGGRYPAGQYSFTFDGNGLPAGVYMYRLTAGNLVETRRMTLLK